MEERMGPAKCESEAETPTHYPTHSLLARNRSASSLHQTLASLLPVSHLSAPPSLSRFLACPSPRGISAVFPSLSFSINQQAMGVAEHADVPPNPGWIPHLDMQFDNEDAAYAFYNSYAACVGFSVRKSKMWTTSKDVLAARTLVCSKQGFRQKKKGFEPKKPRPATRTGCPACMTIKITPSGRYRVTEFVPDHNHLLANPSTARLLRSHRAKVKERIAGDSGMPPDSSDKHQLKRRKAMPVGDAGAVLEYLQRMQVENPSFFYAVRVDGNDSIANFFWADAKSVMDYQYFGDVVCFDMTYKACDCGRPFALFVGVNNHKQMIIFGSALLYDESVESLRWLLDTFKDAMRGKQPKTVLTDQCMEITDALVAAWPRTTHRICVWHVYQNAMMHLNQVFEGSKTFAHDFGQCIFDCEEEEEFVYAWRAMIDKYDLDDNEWLAKLYEDRLTWALPYGKQVFCADIKSSLQKENLISLLKKHLSPQQELLPFFEHYDTLLNERRCLELQADAHAGQNILKVPPLRMLKQAANVYTPAVFKLFQNEFEMYMDCMVYHCGDAGTISDYKVIVDEKSREHFVRYDSSDSSIFCSCKKFESAGIQCRHVFKVLDYRNIKELPPRYILKRWRKDAKLGAVTDHHEYPSADSSKSLIANRDNDLCCIFSTLAARAAKTVESFTFIESQSELLLEQVEHILQTRTFEIPQLTIASSIQPRNLIESVVESLNHDNNTDTNVIISAANGILGF
uniref:Protein FAR1-RELATED SEQUENCE n=1 Tax=Elaeis guineensis var. tenera TaxID=51953 RepID=A0A6J0PSP1_ELAGV|nr:protein FAR1-RELATED SEQUENCE 5 isoform X2 [Elaeis guineensis]XP_019711307.1 protein FAR1-RELATED SEQUENCE 5 isoform X2 [Elaeis guineensis]